MNRGDLVLAALAAAGQSASFRPVQVQKLFFLIDQEIPTLVDGPHFDFRPYDYGPFDSEVYSELGHLKQEGLVLVSQGYYRSYSLTQEGFEKGSAALKSLKQSARVYIQRASAWVLSLSFSQLVTAIYDAYPKMKANSVFK